VKRGKKEELVRLGLLPIFTFLGCGGPVSAGQRRGDEEAEATAVWFLQAVKPVMVARPKMHVVKVGAAFAKLAGTSG
jgi:hypothetical protein